MRFQNYINEQELNILGFIYLIDNINENDDFVSKLQQFGNKVGIKVAKTKTFQSDLKKAGSGVLTLMKMVIDYSFHADVMDKSARNKLIQDMKSQFSKVNKQEVVAFLVNMDRTFFGITSIPRHILQNIVGVELTTYNNWKTDLNYIDTSLVKIITVLNKMGDNDNVKIAKQLYTNVVGKSI